MAYDATSTAELTPVPDHVPPALVHHLDQWNGSEYLVDPISWWDGVRDDRRVFWSPYHGGFWALTRYEDVHQAAQRYDDFSNRLVNIPGRDVRLPPISLDPPEHTTYRRLLNQPFSPMNIEQLTGQIRGLATDLVDGIKTKQQFDFMDDFANPLPTQIFSQMLGLPLDEATKFIEWNYTIVHVQGGEEGNRRQQQANAELGAYLTDLVALRHAQPEKDLISALLPVEIDGRAITEAETVAMTYLLFMAGLDTVIAALGWCWRFLADNPTHRQRIIDEPSIIPNALEELLRYHSFLATTRTVTHDFEFAGVSMKEGDRVMLGIPSAGRDEAQFDNAHVVDFDRKHNRHMAFTVGPHRCVGSHLARAELTIALDVWHQQIPHYRITEGETIQFHGGAVAGPDNLPLTLLPT
jgi:cytochrome P450